MTRAVRRADLEPAYVLHHWPYRDTSRIVELLCRDHGRVSVFARGVRGAKSRTASLLLPFRAILVSFRGRGEAAQLTAVEPAPAPDVAGPGLPAASLMAGFYLNELILRLTTRDDPHPELFGHYEEALQGLARRDVERPLRLFERRLLETLGYGADLTVDARSGSALDPAGYYVFRATEGLVSAVADAPGAVRGRCVLHLAAGRLDDGEDLDAARRVLRTALDHCLEGRELSTRAVARAVARREPLPR
jgi:DNA repair protein RecO (recombination protein O)